MIDFNNPQTLKIPHFSNYEKVEGHGWCFPPNSIDCYKWFERFENKMLNALETKKFFPLFRLSDGEFIFSLGRKFSHYSLKKKIFHYLNHLKRTFYYKSFFYSSGRKGYCETYGILKMKKLRIDFFKYLKFISQNGILCFNYDTHDLTRPYMIDFDNLLKKKNINLTKENYFQFYFVPGFFLGRRIKEIYKNKNILIITSNMEYRNKNLKNCLLKFGAKNVEFYFTSLNQPLLDLIDIRQIKMKPDLCLIGAGVGSSNILTQISELNCPCIDSGFIVDALSDFNLASTRPYYLSNDYYNIKNSWH